MKKIQNLSGFRYIGISVLICLLSAGCANKYKLIKSNEFELKDGEIQRLESENSDLLNEIASLQNKDKESERIKKMAEDGLSGTGITVRTKANGLVSLMLPSAAFFDAGKAVLKNEAKANLKKISVLLNQQFYENIVRIEGHTDNQPILSKKRKYKSNWELSVARAVSVLYYLTESCGITPSNLYVAGFGEYEPIASNSSKTGRDENRRVELVILP